MKTTVITLILMLTTVHLVTSARILAVFPVPARSHYSLGSSLLRAIAEKGHNVTMISAFGEKEPPKNGTYRDIVLTGMVEKMQAQSFSSKDSMFDKEGTNIFVSAVVRAMIVPSLLEGTYQNEEVQKLIHSKEKFDVVIVEQFLNDGMKALATHFGAPLILMCAIGPNFWLNPLVGNPSPPSYIPDFTLEYSPSMTFCERVTNSLLYVLNQLVYNFYVYPKQNEMVKKYISNELDLYDILYNTSIILLNSHESLNQPVPLVPNMIEIGGFHVKPPKKLPQDLQEFLDNSKEGVIYFSMGSNLKSANLPVEKRNAILNTFSKLKQKVLWKWEEDVLPGQPPNVKLSKWLPQQDILAHPNIKLFITHGGYLSTTETVYHGVPVLAIPIFGDQKLNAKNAIINGYGLSVPYSELSEEALTKNINEILNNPKYRDNAKLRSKLFHDRIVSPLDTATYWIEYVIRHKGAPHLRVAALDLPWYKYHLLDVISFFAVIGLCMLFVTYYISKKICKKVCTKKTNKKLKTK